MVWAISKGDEGVAVYLTATVQSKDEIKFGAVAYILEKDVQEKWKAKQKLGMKEGQTHMTLSSGDWKTKFPKIGDRDGTKSFSRKGIDSDYWYFLDNGGTQVSSEQTEHRRNNWWKWNNNSSSGIYKLKDWSSNFDVWWNYFFGTDKLDMQKLMVTTNTFGSWSP